MNASQPDRRLRILHLILGLKPPNGQYHEHCLPLLHERDITVCTYFKSEVTPPKELKVFEGDNSVRGFFRALRASLKDREYDIIHVHTPHAGILLLTGLFLTGLYRKLKPSTVHTIQNCFQNFKLRNKLLFIPSFPFFRKVVFCSQASYDSFPRVLKWFGRNRMHVVQNAVDLGRIDRLAVRRSAENSQQFSIATVGLIDIKNPCTVFEAFRHSQDASSHLVILGDGNLRSLLTRAIAESALQEQVTLAGMIPRDEALAAYWQADVFVSASHGEGLPVAVMEAMACRCPVILSDIPPHREVAEGADFIPFLKPHDTAGFAREISRFKAMSTAERRTIGDRCRKVIENRFSLPLMHASYSNIYAEVTHRTLSTV